MGGKSRNLPTTSAGLPVRWFLLHRASDLLSDDGVTFFHGYRACAIEIWLNALVFLYAKASELDTLPLAHLQLVQLPLSL